MSKRTCAATIGAAAVLVLAGAGCSDEGNVFALEVGACFQEFDDLSEVGEVETVDCDEPHFAEVFHTEDLEGGDDDFPGETEVGSLGEEICSSEFEDYVGAALGESDFVPSLFQPTEDSWGQGDREIACFVVSLTGEETEGSAEDSGPGEGTEGSEDTEVTGGDDDDADEADDEDGSSLPGAGDEGDPTDPPDLDDPELAALAEDCFAGSGTACDELFIATDVGSEEEEYGNTCGGRFDSSPGLCAVAIGE